MRLPLRLRAVNEQPLPAATRVMKYGRSDTTLSSRRKCGGIPEPDRPDTCLTHGARRSEAGALERPGLRLVFPVMLPANGAGAHLDPEGSVLAFPGELGRVFHA